MRFLANENVPGPVVRALRELGRDVLWAKQDLAGETDRVVLARAQTDQRVTVTCDTDFVMTLGCQTFASRRPSSQPDPPGMGVHLAHFLFIQARLST